VEVAVRLKLSIVCFVKSLYGLAAPRRSLVPTGVRKKNLMLQSIHALFKPADQLAQERMTALELNLDAIAQEATARFCRGNAAVQMGLMESEEELDAKRQATIARRV
jgi:hypothetical protein